MIKAGKYLPLGRLALAAVLLVASSGFTMLLHSCQMESRECCDTMAAHGTMQTPTGYDGPVASFVQPPSSCCQNTIVGGLNRTSATLETPATSLCGKTALAVVNPLLPDGQPQAFSSLLLTLQQVHPPSPPPNGLYISNSALLI